MTISLRPGAGHDRPACRAPAPSARRPKIAVAGSGGHLLALQAHNLVIAGPAPSRMQSRCGYSARAVRASMKPMTDNPARNPVAPLTGDHLSGLATIGSGHAAAAREILFSAGASSDLLAVLGGYMDIVERRCCVVIGPPRGGDSLPADPS